MSNSQSSNYSKYYFTGAGAVPLGYAYVEREADKALHQALIDGEFCYVLNSRQTGKSSLRIHTRKRLEENIENINCAVIDLEGLGVHYDQASDWYLAQITIMVDDLKLNAQQWWENCQGESSVKYQNFIEQVLLKQVEGNIIIFIDEIDTVLSLKFSTDDFFAFIRFCHERRNENPEYKRLTFCLLGVADPNSLITNKQRTPFNIGRAISLKPFEQSQVAPLMEGLKQHLGNLAEIAMREILEWTQGQPFLTYKLCQLIVEDSNNLGINSINIELVKSYIENLVCKKIININTTDNTLIATHLRTIKDRLLCTLNDDTRNDERSFKLLSLYKRILKNTRIRFDNTYDQIDLMLSGAVLKQEGFLQVYNPIYREVFNLNWVETERKKLRLYVEKFEGWKTADTREKEKFFIVGDQLEQAWEFRNQLQQVDQDILGQELEFFNESQEFWDDAQKSLTDDSAKKAIIEAMNKCTGGLDIFNNKFLEIVKDQEQPKMGTAMTEVENWVEKLIESHLKHFKKAFDFNDIEDKFLNPSNHADPYQLLLLYKKIWQQDKLDFNPENKEHQALRNMDIIIQKENKLRIFNGIYYLIFNQDWVDDLLSKMCPYIKDLENWQNHSKSSVYLLREERLENALNWIENKEVSKDHHEFILASIVKEIWKLASENNQKKAVDVITQYQSKLKNKTANYYPLVQECLRWTQDNPELLKQLLEWGGESETIPIKDLDQWLEQIVQSHLQNFSTVELAHQYCQLNHINKIAGKSPSDFQIIDDAIRLSSSRNLRYSEIEVKDFLKVVDNGYIFSYDNRANKILNQVSEALKQRCLRLFQIYTGEKERMTLSEIKKLLDKVVDSMSEKLTAIIVFNLKNGSPMLHNTQLEERNKELHDTLYISKKDQGEAEDEQLIEQIKQIKFFKKLGSFQDDLNELGETIRYKDITLTTVRLEQGIIFVHFDKLPTVPIAICFFLTDVKDEEFWSYTSLVELRIKEIARKIQEVFAPIED